MYDMFYCDDQSGSSQTLQQRLVTTRLCILDLGGIIEERQMGHYGEVGAWGYRAPEVSLGKGLYPVL